VLIKKELVLEKKDQLFTPKRLGFGEKRLDVF